MASVINLTPTSEVEAVNAMLASVGEAPVDCHDLSSRPDTALALRLLKAETKEVQTMRWRFNTEYELPLGKAATMLWREPDGSTVLIDVFVPPTQGLATWSLSECSKQEQLQVSLRPAKQYDPQRRPPVFYDSTRNRDGFPAGERLYLYIDAVWFFDFQQLPEVARRYITCRAARQYAEKALASGELGGFAKADELFALRLLKREEGHPDVVNMLQSIDTLRVRGGRPGGGEGVVTARRWWR